LDIKSKNTTPSEPVQSNDWSIWDEVVKNSDPIETGRNYSHWLLKLLVIAACCVSVCYAARGMLLWGQYDHMADVAAAGPSYLLWGALVALGTLMWLAFTAGKSANYDGVRKTFIEAIPTDVLLLVCIAAIAGCVYLLNVFTANGLAQLNAFAMGEVSSAILLTMYLPISAAVLAFLLFYMSFVRRLRLHMAYRNSLLGLLTAKLRMLLRSVVTSIRAGTLSRRTTAATLGYVFLGCTLLGLTLVLTTHLNALGALVGAALFLTFVMWLNHRMLRRARELERIVDDVKRIGRGELSHRTAASNASEFRTLTEGINTMARGLEVSLEEKLRAERLRTELITNVSHDLRTPLTSLITYIDLIKNAELDEDTRARYLEVLEQKAQRLKTLTDDLFEAAKAASGTLPVQRERIDVKALLTQGLTELEDAIASSGVSVQVHYKHEPVYAMADGQRLWRTLDNLITNALKYSVPGTRVHIQVETTATLAVITVKNVSREPLSDDDVDLLAERFTRGDSAPGFPQRISPQQKRRRSLV